MFSIAKAIYAFFSFLSGLIGWRQRAEDRQAGRDEVIKESQREELDAQSRAGNVLAERRTFNDTDKRMSDGSF